MRPKTSRSTDKTVPANMTKLAVHKEARPVGIKSPRPSKEKQIVIMGTNRNKVVESKSHPFLFAHANAATHT